MSGNCIPAKPRQRMEKLRQAMSMTILLVHKKELIALLLLPARRRGRAGSTEEPAIHRRERENRNKLPRACGTAYRRGTAMKAFLFLLAGSAGLLLAGWGSTWLAYALTRGVLSLAHLAAAVAGLALAWYGLGRWELCD